MIHNCNMNPVVDKVFRHGNGGTVSPFVPAVAVWGSSVTQDIVVP